MEERNNSSLYNKQQDPKVWQTFWNQYANTYLKSAQALTKASKKLVNKWKDISVINGDSKVLDIGCGPGTLALPLAEEVKEIVAVDMSEKMLKVVLNEANKNKLNNITIKQEDWEEVNYDREFDVVLAATSPAVYNFNNLLKMNQAVPLKNKHTPIQRKLK